MDSCKAIAKINKLNANRNVVMYRPMRNEK